MRRLLFLIIILTGGLNLFAQPALPKERKRAVYGNGYYLSPSKYEYKNLALSITSGAMSKYEQAQMLYLWLCDNISYDTQDDIRTADECWEHKRAVCQGYCELFYRMAETLKLKTTLVYGISRNASGSQEEHSWLSVKTEKGKILMDPTWGAGAIVNGKFRRQEKPLIWFDTAPEVFIFTHLPNNKKHQHLKKKVDEDTWQHQMEYLSPLHVLPDENPLEKIYSQEKKQ